jgi:GAF domain-containing protein
VSARGGSRAIPLPPLDAELVRRWVRAAESAGGRAAGAATRERARVEVERALRLGGARLIALASRLEKRAKSAPTASARASRRLAALLHVRAHAETAAQGALLQALAALRDALGYERATAFFFDARTDRLVPAAIAGGHVDLIPDIVFDHGEGFSSWVAKTRRPVLLSAFREEPDMPLTDRPASFLSVPVQEGASFLGVLNFAHRAPGAFTTADRDLAVLAGRLVAAGVERARAAAPAIDAESAPSHSGGSAR